MTDSPLDLGDLLGDDVPQTYDAADLVDPETGEVIDREDTDTLIDTYDGVCIKLKELASFKAHLIKVMVDKTTSTNKTRRLRGNKLEVKIEMPDVSWDGAKLREAWEAYPRLRDELLRIGRIAVKQREYNKALAASGEPDFECFVNIIKSANRGATQTPRVTVEKS